MMPIVTEIGKIAREKMKMKMMCESKERNDENDDDDDDRTKYSRPRKEQLTNIEKTVVNSGSSHRGKNVGCDFFDENGELVERKTVRKYIREEIGARQILNLSEKSIDNVVNRFCFNVKKPNDPNKPIPNPNYHPDYKGLIKNMIKNQLSTPKKVKSTTKRAPSKKKALILDPSCSADAEVKTAENADSEIVHKNLKLVKELRKMGCKEHGDTNLIDNGEGDLVCTECGVVVEDRMICEDAEWRNFNDDSITEKWSKSRTGGAENLFLSDDANDNDADSGRDWQNRKRTEGNSDNKNDSLSITDVMFTIIKSKKQLLKKLRNVKEVLAEFEKHYDEEEENALVMLAEDRSGGGIIGCIAGCDDVYFEEDSFNTIFIPKFSSKVLLGQR